MATPPPQTSTPPMSTPQNLPFSLQEGEKVAEAIKPPQQSFIMKNIV